MLLMLCALPLFGAVAQNLEKSISLGVRDITFNLDKNVGNQFSVGGTIGFGNTFGFTGSSSVNGFYSSEGRFYYAMTPMVSFRSYWHYNLNKRAKAEKPIQHNASNYVKLELLYADKALLKTSEDFLSERSLKLLPSWGLRRPLSHDLMFDFNVGMGVQQSLQAKKFDLHPCFILDFALSFYL